MDWLSLIKNVVKFFHSDLLLPLIWILALCSGFLLWKPEIIPDNYLKKYIELFALIFSVSAIVLSTFKLIYYLNQNKIAKNFHIEIVESKSYVSFNEKDKSIALDIHGTVKNFSSSNLIIVKANIIKPKFKKIFNNLFWL